MHRTRSTKKSIHNLFLLNDWTHKLSTWDNRFCHTNYYGSYSLLDSNQLIDYHVEPLAAISRDSPRRLGIWSAMFHCRNGLDSMTRMVLWPLLENCFFQRKNVYLHERVNICSDYEGTHRSGNSPLLRQLTWKLDCHPMYLTTNWSPACSESGTSVVKSRSAPKRCKRTDKSTFVVF